jgi:fatty acid desaturase
MINLLYIFSFFIIGIILFLILKDLKKIKSDLYQEIDKSIWIKLYIIMMIGTIHFIWIFYSIFLDYKDNNYIYAIPVYLIILYFIYILITFINIKNKENNPTIVIDKLLNYSFIIYVIFILLFICTPTNYTKDFIKYLNSIIHKNLLDE